MVDSASPAIVTLTRVCASVCKSLFVPLVNNLFDSPRYIHTTGMRRVVSDTVVSKCNVIQVNTPCSVTSTISTPSKRSTPQSALCTTTPGAPSVVQSDLMAFQIVQVAREFKRFCNMQEPDQETIGTDPYVKWFADVYSVILQDEETLIICLILAKRCRDSGLVFKSNHFTDLSLGCALIASKLHHDHDLSMFSTAWALDTPRSRLDQAESAVLSILLHLPGEGLFVQRCVFEKELCAVRGVHYQVASAEKAAAAYMPRILGIR